MGYGQRQATRRVALLRPHTFGGAREVRYYAREGRADGVASTHWHYPLWRRSHFPGRASRRSCLLQLGAGGVAAATTYPLISSAKTLPGKRSSDMDDATIADTIPVRLRVNGKLLSLLTLATKAA